LAPPNSSIPLKLMSPVVTKGGDDSGKRPAFMGPGGSFKGPGGL
jgi:hypothetical protein